MNSIIDSNGVERFLANLEPPPGHLMKAFPVYGDRADTPMIPRSQWPALITAMGDWKTYPLLPPTHDQGAVGQCNCDATTGMGESARLKQGLPLVQLSAADLYDRINGGSDRGSLLEDAMEEMLKNGVGTLATCGPQWRRGMKTATPEERRRFRFLEVFTAPTFDHLFSGILAGFDGNSGIMWGSRDNPDGDGYLPPSADNAGGHSIHAYMPAMRQGRGGVEFGIAHHQSWGDRWGLNSGRFVIPESRYRGPVGGWFLSRVITDEGGVLPEVQL